MIDTDVVLEALNVLCSDGLISVPTQRRDAASSANSSFIAGASQTQRSITHLIPLAVRGAVGFWNQSLDGAFGGLTSFINLPEDLDEDKETGRITINPKDFAWSKKHLDPGYNFDFSDLKDTEKYYRGGEEYKRPCGWQRFALKVLDEYEDDRWLGTQWRSTESVSGEWPVSYHGTQQEFVKAIIDERYKAGDRAAYGRGIYSTPDFDIAKAYATEFTSNGTQFKVIMQNRINPKYRKICSNKYYWLVPIPEDASREVEQGIVEKAIRPYGLLLKAV